MGFLPNRQHTILDDATKTKYEKISENFMQFMSFIQEIEYSSRNQSNERETKLLVNLNGIFNNSVRSINASGYWKVHWILKQMSGKRKWNRDENAARTALKMKWSTIQAWGWTAELIPLLNPSLSLVPRNPFSIMCHVISILCFPFRRTVDK